MDPSNTPHSGGNQWAGGTGGSDTAGLGGIGGPYRLDAGHTVTQVGIALWPISHLISTLALFESKFESKTSLNFITA